MRHARHEMHLSQCLGQRIVVLDKNERAVSKGSAWGLATEELSIRFHSLTDLMTCSSVSLKPSNIHRFLPDLRTIFYVLVNGMTTCPRRAFSSSWEEQVTTVSDAQHLVFNIRKLVNVWCREVVDSIIH